MSPPRLHLRGHDPVNVRHLRNQCATFVGGLKWALSVLSVIAGHAAAQPAGAAHDRPPAASAASSALLRFDLPAQPLDKALEQYGAISGRPVIFDGTMVANRTSSAVQGVYTAEAALRQLLDGTGLTADYADAEQTDAFVLKAVAAAQAPAAADAASNARQARHSAYDGLIQARLWDAFCNIPSIVPGDYRAVVQFDIDPTGRLTHVRLLRGSGERERDVALQRALEQIQLDEAPPADLEQPVSMLVQPAQRGPQCRPRP